jgi:two-component system, OmpR family, copper resistance phosphate regulon response regulator CusR
VLVVEDEPRMANLLRQGLTEEGYVVTVAASGVDALNLALGYAFDAMVLDVMLPGMDGFAVTRRLRERHNQVPILMLTARDAAGDIVTGLDLGADDYLTKPFSFDVLLARLRALGRRGSVAQSTVLRVADLTLDAGPREVKRAGRELHLTRTEFSILELLMRNAGRVVARESIIEQVWGHMAEIESNTLDAFVRLLRAKVEPAGGAKLIHTVRGVGYTLKAGEPA